MPAKTTALRLFFQRQAAYLVMFGAVTFHRSALPGVSVQRVVEKFRKWWGPDAPSEGTLTRAYYDMHNEFVDLQKSLPEEKTFRVQVSVEGRDMVLSIPATSEIEARQRTLTMLERHAFTFGPVEEDAPLAPVA